MTPILWPASLRPSSCDWRLVTRTASVVSPFTGARQDIELPGALWQCTLTFDALTLEEERALSGLLSRLRGPVGRVYVPDFAHFGNRGSAGGTMRATGAMDAKVITVTGITGNGVAFAVGDRIEIDARIYEVCVDAVADGGAATLEIAPPLRVAAVNVRLWVEDLHTIMQLQDDRQHGRRQRGSAPPSREVTFVEALR